MEPRIATPGHQTWQRPLSAKPKKGKMFNIPRPRCSYARSQLLDLTPSQRTLLNIVKAQTHTHTNTNTKHKHKHKPKPKPKHQKTQTHKKKHKNTKTHKTKKKKKTTTNTHTHTHTHTETDRYIYIYIHIYICICVHSDMTWYSRFWSDVIRYATSLCGPLNAGLSHDPKPKTLNPKPKTLTPKNIIQTWSQLPEMRLRVWVMQAGGLFICYTNYPR